MVLPEGLAMDAVIDHAFLTAVRTYHMASPDDVGTGPWHPTTATGDTSAVMLAEEITFETFGGSHLVVLAVTVGVSLGLPMLVRRVKSARLRLTGRRKFSVTAEVEIGSYLLGKLDADAEGLFGKALRRLLKKRNRVEVEGYFFAVKGMGFYKTRSARINGHKVPQSWIRKLTQLVGRHQRPPLDLNQLFILSPGVERIAIDKGRVDVRLRRP